MLLKIQIGSPLVSFYCDFILESFLGVPVLYHHPPAHSPLCASMVKPKNLEITEILKYYEYTNNLTNLVFVVFTGWT